MAIPTDEHLFDDLLRNKTADGMAVYEQDPKNFGRDDSSAVGASRHRVRFPVVCSKFESPERAERPLRS